MSLKFKYYEKVVGFFMLSGLFILLVTVILMGREQKWFQKKITLTTIFNKGDGLSKGMEVKINGLAVGRVNNFGFANDNRISVSFEVYKEFIKKIRSDSYVFKESSSPLGGGFLSLSIGKETSPIATNNAFLYSEDSELVSSLIQNNIIIKKEGSFDNIIKGVNLLITQLAAPKGPLIGTLNNLDDMSRMLSKPGGTLTTLFGDDNKLYNEILLVMTTLATVAKDFNVMSTTIRNSAPDIKPMINSAKQGIDEANKVMIGLQNYFSVSTVNTKAKQNKTTTETKIKYDRRSRDY